MRIGIAFVLFSVLACGRSSREPAGAPTMPSPHEGAPGANERAPSVRLDWQPVTPSCQPREIPVPTPSGVEASPDVPCWGPLCWETYPQGGQIVGVTSWGEESWAMGNGPVLLHRRGVCWQALCPPALGRLGRAVAWRTALLVHAEADEDAGAAGGLYRWDGNRWSLARDAGRFHPLVATDDVVLFIDAETRRMWSWDGELLHDEGMGLTGIGPFVATSRGREAWVLDRDRGELFHRASSGWRMLALPPRRGYCDVWLWSPRSIAVDEQGAVWVAGSEDDGSRASGFHEHPGRPVLYRLADGRVERQPWASTLGFVYQVSISRERLVILMRGRAATAVGVFGFDGAPIAVPEHEGARGIHVLPDGGVLTVGNRVFRLQEDAWHEEAALAPGMNVVGGSGAKDLWAGGDALWRFDGARWTEVVGADGSSFFSQIDAAAVDDVWACCVGSLGRGGFLHWDGARIERVAAPPGVGGAISAVPGALWAVSGPTLWRLDASGWSSFATGYEAGPNGFPGQGWIPGIWASSADEVWAAAMVPAETRGLPTRTAILHLRGETIEANETGMSPYGFAHADATLWAFGQEGRGVPGGLLRLDAGGWERVPGPALIDLVSARDGTLYGIAPEGSGGIDTILALHRFTPGDGAWRRLRTIPGWGYPRAWTAPDDGTLWIANALLLRLRRDLVGDP